jgi:hypothetical protein
MAEEKAEKGKKGKPKITAKDVEDAFEELKEESGEEALVMSEDDGKYELILLDGKKMRRLSKLMSGAQFLKCCQFTTKVLKATAE